MQPENDTCKNEWENQRVDTTKPTDEQSSNRKSEQDIHIALVNVDNRDTVLFAQFIQYSAGCGFSICHD